MNIMFKVSGPGFGKEHLNIIGGEKIQDTSSSQYLGNGGAFWGFDYRFW